jgi:hypothetical protein
MMDFVFDDGGRETAGYKGKAGDCVTRAIAIATGKPYHEVYYMLNVTSKSERVTKRRSKRSSARTGVWKDTSRKYLESLGWKWHPTMLIGQGCKVHLVANELPSGRVIVKISKHMVTVIDGVIHDTYNSSEQRANWLGQKREGPRCVYGYYTQN